MTWCESREKLEQDAGEENYDNFTTVSRRRSLSVGLAIVQLSRKKRMPEVLLHDGCLALATSNHWTGAATGRIRAWGALLVAGGRGASGNWRRVNEDQAGSS